MKKDKGVTLISLIITIIILLILVGIGITISTRGSVSQKARNVVNKANNQTRNASEQEDEVIEDIRSGKGSKSPTEPENSIKYNVKINNKSYTSFTISASGSSKNSTSLTYELKIDDTSYETKSGETVSWNITGLTPGQEYTYTIIAKDEIAEKKKTGKVKMLENNTPTIVTSTLKSKTTNTLTISAKATDAEGENISYKLYTSLNENGTYTEQELKSDVVSNREVTLNATNLTQYTDYYWYVTASDGITTARSEKKRTRTYCPGTGSNTCNESTVVNCATCSGTGKITKNCAGGTACTSCSGTGRCTSSFKTSYVGGSYACHECGVYVRAVRYDCSNCGAYYGPFNTCGHDMGDIQMTHGSCRSCSGTGGTGCSAHGKVNAHTYQVTCTACNGSKTYRTTCSHGKTTSHSCCAHNKIIQHDS